MDRLVHIGLAFTRLLASAILFKSLLGRYSILVFGSDLDATESGLALENPISLGASVASIAILGLLAFRPESPVTALVLGVSSIVVLAYHYYRMITSSPACGCFGPDVPLALERMIAAVFSACGLLYAGWQLRMRKRTEVAGS